MKIILIVEGDTEKEVLPGFLQRWLAGKVDPLPAIKAVNTRGCDNHIKECATKARLHLAAPDVLAVFGLLDLHGPKNIPANCTSIKDKCDHLRQRLETEVGSPKFKQHFAVHELEAWLLSDPDIFPLEVKRALPAKTTRPESVNSTEPPKQLLERLYRDKTRREYKNRTDGSVLFSKLDPEVARAKCPALAALLTDLLAVAQQSHP
ncbi:MAG: DUF4276 family protein [Solidesulfovibrio sp. DCME]|uniref:DUF4276 family protein n=1 Tax=Solidesulfovibrio sp. DCME TaxID=3447380 RepID=UPI003D0C5BFE